MKCDQYPCSYCFTSCAIKRKRTTFKPDELATTFVSLNRERRVDGLFLSSGIVPDADTTIRARLGGAAAIVVKHNPVALTIAG